MDPSIIYCALFLFFILFQYFKQKFSVTAEKPKPFRSNLRQNSSSRSSFDATRRLSRQDLDVIRNMSMDELEELNAQFGRQTDRYWREMFRRNNTSNSPDTVVVSNLTSQNMTTVLEEQFPIKGSIHSFTVTGLNPSSHSHMIKYLRHRIGNHPEVELKITNEGVCIVPVAKRF